MLTYIKIILNSVILLHYVSLAAKLKPLGKLKYLHAVNNVLLTFDVHKVLLVAWPTRHKGINYTSISESDGHSFCSGKRPSLETQLAQKICIIVLRMAKRSDSDFPCSDILKRTVTEGTQCYPEDMSFAIEDWKIFTI